MSTSRRDPRLHVVFVTSVGFPNGMAASSRIRLMARAIVEGSGRARVLCVGPTEWKSTSKNVAAKGNYRGVEFEYTSGTTLRADTRLARRWVDLRSIVATLWRLLRLKRAGQLDCVYLYTNMREFTYQRWIYLAAARVLGTPVLLELCERPWTLATTADAIRRRLHPLWGASGVVAISDFLHDWAAACSPARAVLRVPILVDVAEQTLTIYPRGPMSVLFAASPSYSKATRFVLDAMRRVWEEYPECRLVLTGYAVGDPATSQLAAEAASRDVMGRVDFVGYLPREELLSRYRCSSALLAPLFDDVESRARFPTKLGEYLASARPVVTNSVGEVAKYLADRQSAYICRPDDPAAYGAKIAEVLADPASAEKVGLTGRNVAEEHFQYSLHSEYLMTHIASLCKASSGRPATASV